MPTAKENSFEAWMDIEHPNWRGYQKTPGGKENNIVARMRAAWLAGRAAERRHIVASISREF